MKKLLLTSALALVSVFVFGQERPSQIRAYYSALVPIEWGTDHAYSGAGIGVSSRLSKSWVLNVDASFYGRDIPSGSGYVDRSILDVRGGVDYYFSRAYHGFFVGAFMGYTQIDETRKEGASPIPGPDQLVPGGFALGFTSALSDKLDLHFKGALGLGSQSSMYNFNVGLGYRF